MASIISAGTTSTTALNLSGDTTGVLQLQTNGTTAAITIDTSQNVGIGVTPSAWSAYKGLNIGLNTTLAGSTGGSVALLSTNAYFDGSSYKYITTDAATQYQQNTGEHIWRTAASGSAGATLTFTERMRITSTGIVGIGTSSPGGKLQVKANTNISLYVGNSGLGSMELGNYDATDGYNPLLVDGSYVAFATGTAGGQSVTERMRITSDGKVGIGTSSPTSILEVTGGAGNEFRATRGTNNFVISLSNNIGGDVYVGTSVASALLLQTSNTERMRITSDGYTKMSNTGTYVSSTGPYHEIVSDSINETLVIRGSAGSLAASGIVYIDANRNTTNNSFYVMSYYNNGAAAFKFRIADSGNVTNTNGSYGTISDIKNKENIVDATPKLDKVNQLKVRNYNFIGDDLKQIGFVAQEFEQVFPSMVEEHHDKDADGNDLGTTTKSIKTSVLVPILVKAIQELNAKVEAQAAEIQALKGAR